MPHLRIEEKHSANAAAISKSLRQRLELSRPQMARWLGVTRQYISKLEGGVPPSKPVLLLLLKLEEESRRHPERNGSPREHESTSSGFPLPQPLVGVLDSWRQIHTPAEVSEDSPVPGVNDLGDASANGIGEQKTPFPAPARRSPRITSPPVRGRSSHIPLLDMHEAAEMHNLDSITKRARQMLSFPTMDKHSFAVRIAGEAMWPRCMDGDVAILYPSLKPRNGDLVFARPTDEKGGGLLLRLAHFTEGDGTMQLTCNHTASPPVSLFRNDCLWMVPVVVIIRQLR